MTGGVFFLASTPAVVNSSGDFVSGSAVIAGVTVVAVVSNVVVPSDVVTCSATVDGSLVVFPVVSVS